MTALLATLCLKDHVRMGASELDLLSSPVLLLRRRISRWLNPKAYEKL